MKSHWRQCFRFLVSLPELPQPIRNKLLQAFTVTGNAPGSSKQIRWWNRYYIYFFIFSFNQSVMFSYALKYHIPSESKSAGPLILIVILFYLIMIFFKFRLSEKYQFMLRMYTVFLTNGLHTVSHLKFLESFVMFYYCHNCRRFTIPERLCKAGTCVFNYLGVKLKCFLCVYF